MPKTSINLTHNPFLCQNFIKTYRKSRKSFKTTNSLKFHKLKHWISNQTEKNSNFDSTWDLKLQKLRTTWCLFVLIAETKLWFDKKRRAKIPSFHKLKKIFLEFLDRFLCLGRTRNWWNLWRGFASGRRRRPWRRRLGNRGEFFAKKCEKFRENKTRFREKLDLT